MKLGMGRIDIDTIKRATQEDPVKRVRIRIQNGKRINEYWMTQAEIQELRLFLAEAE